MRKRSVSLRTRLVAVSVTLVAFSVVAIGTATYLALRGYLLSGLDDDLDRAADRLKEYYIVAGPAPRDLPPPSGVDTQAGLVTPDGTLILLGRTRGDSGTPLTAALAVQVAQAEDEVSVRDAAGQTLRATSRSLPSDSQLVVPHFGEPAQLVNLPDGTRLIVTIPTGGLESTLGKLLGLELVGGALVVAAAGVLSALGVRLGLRPLDRVTRTAQAVAAELSPDGTGLDRRVPASDPTTEVGQLAEAVNRMLDAVETEYGARYESEQRMRSFLADASHELRTPLTSLRGYAELIRLRGKEGSDPEARDALRRIEAEGTRMSRLVDDLLTLARHDRGLAPVRAPVPVSDVVADAVAGAHAAYPDRAITIVESGEPATVPGDRDQLLQVVRNVLTNAAVHTPDGPITVTVSTVAGEAVVAIRDAGPGLSAEQAARVFDRFWRADIARTRIRGGSGLGLSIVQALVSAHGGRVTFESTPAGGTTVTIHLPVAPVGEPGPPGPRPTARRSTPPMPAGRDRPRLNP